MEHQLGCSNMFVVIDHAIEARSAGIALNGVRQDVGWEVGECHVADRGGKDVLMNDWM